MLQITNISSSAIQQMVLTGIPGIRINLTLRFMPRIQTWIMDIGYNDFLAQGIALVTSPNILRQWRNIIPFGIACTDIYRLDPYTINDFASGAATLFLLSAADVAVVENTVYGNANFSVEGNGTSA